MSRKIVFIGAQSAPPLDSYADPHPVWPDVDRKFDGSGTPIPLAGLYDDGQYVQQSPGLQAIALAPSTDWDQVLIKFAGESEWRMLGPGIVLRPEAGTVDSYRVKPAIPCPSTRLYDASILRTDKSQATLPPYYPPRRVQRVPIGDTVSPFVPAAVGASPNSWALDLTGDGNNHHFKNLQGGSWQVYKLTKWGGWAPFETVTSGGFTTAATDNGAAGPLASSNRAADFSPDGVWSFADYMAAGFVPFCTVDMNHVSGYADASACIISSAPVDNHGNAGDPTNGSAIPYAAQLTIGGMPWGPLSNRFAAALSLELFLGECPPASYRPLLPPQRMITLPALVLAAAGSIPSNAPDGTYTPILTFPTINVERVQWTVESDGSTTGSPTITLGMASARDAIDGQPAAQTIQPSPGLVITRGQGGSVFIDDAACPFVQLLGYGDGTTALLAGSQVVITRRFVG
jgi:hypothetical protein